MEAKGDIVQMLVGETLWLGVCLTHGHYWISDENDTCPACQSDAIAEREREDWRVILWDAVE